MPYAKVNGFRLYYEIHGSIEPPLLLFAGFGASSGDWVPDVIDAISKSRQIILFDNRGIGHSDNVPPPYSMTQYAADVVGLLDVLKIEKTHVMGHSMGGMIAQYLALDYPERVLSLTLAATGPGGPQTPGVFPPTPDVLAKLTKPPSDDRGQDIRDRWPIIYTPSFISTNRARLEQYLCRKLDLPETDPTVLEGQALAMFTTHDTIDRLSEIQCPTLIQTGAEDILVPAENSHLMAERIPHATLIEYANCAHGFYEESEFEAVADLLAFIQAVDAGQYSGSST